MKCKQCGMIFIHPQPTSQELVELYSRDYFERGEYRCGHAGNCFEEEGERIISHELLEKISRQQPRGTFLDVGCASGHLLNAVREKGYETYGVELSDEAAQNARNKFGLNVITGDVLSANYEQNFFDTVFIGDVLEHIPNPVSVMKEIHRISKPNARVIILCPTQTNTLFSRFGFFAYRILRKNATVNLPPYHLLEFRPTSIKYLLIQNGFTVVEIQSTAMKPSEIALRNSLLHNLAKKFFQYPNYVLTRTLNVFGDRITMIAQKNNSE